MLLSCVCLVSYPSSAADPYIWLFRLFFEFEAEGQFKCAPLDLWERAWENTGQVLIDVVVPHAFCLLTTSVLSASTSCRCSTLMAAPWCVIYCNQDGLLTKLQTAMLVPSTTHCQTEAKKFSPSPILIFSSPISL
jgi:hypothetical protein